MQTSSSPAPSITLTLSPERQAELEQRASAAGIDLTTLVVNAVEETLAERSGDAAETIPYEQWSTEFRSWVARQSSRNPQFDDSRESIYD